MEVSQQRTEHVLGLNQEIFSHSTHHVYRLAYRKDGTDLAKNSATYRRSFREGIDVAGEALSLVVMDKAPFAPPDDPVTAKLREKAGDAAFREIFLPKAQVAMRQGAGRLMRRPDDRGVIAILDPRIFTEGWGKAILSSLPPAPRTTEIAEVARFFEA